MVRVCIVALICYVFNGTKALFINSCEAVAKRLSRCAVKSKTDICLRFPIVTGFTQTVHYLKRKLCSLRCSMAYTLNELGNLVKTNVSQRNGGVTAKQ